MPSRTWATILRRRRPCCPDPASSAQRPGAHFRLRRTLQHEPGKARPHVPPKAAVTAPPCCRPVQPSSRSGATFGRVGRARRPRNEGRDALIVQISRPHAVRFQAPRYSLYDDLAGLFRYETVVFSYLLCGSTEGTSMCGHGHCRRARSVVGPFYAAALIYNVQCLPSWVPSNTPRL